jgi:hypothetical protein
MGRPSRYPEEFRREAVQMALASSDSSASIARRLGVNETTHRNWVANELAEQARQPNSRSAGYEPVSVEGEGADEGGADALIGNAGDLVGCEGSVDFVDAGADLVGHALKEIEKP